MKTKTILAAGLLIVGGGLLGQWTRMESLRSTNEKLRREVAEAAGWRPEIERLRSAQDVPAEVARLRERAAAADLEVSRLRGRLGALLRGRGNPDPTGGTSRSRSAFVFTPAGLGPSEPAGADGLKGAIDFQIDARMAQARERLHLNPDQEQTIRGVVSRAVEDGRKDLQRVLAGQARPDEVPTGEQWATALERQLLSQLTPEQQADYQQYKRQDIGASARLLANGELLQVQNTLGLSPDQQDQMFAVLYSQTVSQLEMDPTYNAPRPKEPLAALQWQSEQRLKSLEAVLTSSQWEAYRQIEESRVKYVKGLLGRSGTP